MSTPPVSPLIREVFLSNFGHDRACNCKNADAHLLFFQIFEILYFFAKQNSDLDKKVAGHNEERSVQIYSHINEQIGREQSQKEQVKRKMKLIG